MYGPVGKLKIVQHRGQGIKQLGEDMVEVSSRFRENVLLANLEMNPSLVTSWA